MPTGPIPARFLPLLEGSHLGHLATISEDGRPQVNPVWFLWGGEGIQIGVKGDTVKYRNLRRDPHMALSIADPGAPHHYIELRGTVVGFERYRDLSFVNLLSRKYTGDDMDPSENGKERYKLTIRVDSWTGQ